MNRLDHDEVRQLIDADPGALYDIVSNVTRTPEWSPEVVSCSWLDDATGPAVGARFQARNKRRWFSWSNKPVVDVADRAREFAFTRTERGGGSIRWSYRFEPGDAGTTVVLSYDVLRKVPVGLHMILRVLFGVRDLGADLHENMGTSLTRLAALAVNTPSGGR
jgi:hypothetical protein